MDIGNSIWLQAPRTYDPQNPEHQQQLGELVRESSHLEVFDQTDPAKMQPGVVDGIAIAVLIASKAYAWTLEQRGSELAKFRMLVTLAALGGTVRYAYRVGRIWNALRAERKQGETFVRQVLAEAEQQGGRLQFIENYPALEYVNGWACKAQLEAGCEDPKTLAAWVKAYGIQPHLQLPIPLKSRLRQSLLTAAGQKTWRQFSPQFLNEVGVHLGTQIKAYIERVTYTQKLKRCETKDLGRYKMAWELVIKHLDGRSLASLLQVSLGLRQLLLSKPSLIDGKMKAASISQGLGDDFSIVDRLGPHYLIAEWQSSNLAHVPFRTIRKVVAVHETSEQCWSFYPGTLVDASRVRLLAVDVDEAHTVYMACSWTEKAELTISGYLLPSSELALPAGTGPVRCLEDDRSLVLCNGRYFRIVDRTSLASDGSGAKTRVLDPDGEYSQVLLHEHRLYWVQQGKVRSSELFGEEIHTEILSAEASHLEVVDSKLRAYFSPGQFQNL